MPGAEIIATLSLLLNVLVAVIGFTLGISRINSKVKETFEGEIISIKSTVSESELSMERKIGEVGSALREKIAQVELFNRDTFVRRDSFQQTTMILTKTMENQFDRLQRSVDMLAEKIEKYQTRGSGV